MNSVRFFNGVSSRPFDATARITGEELLIEYIKDLEEQTRSFAFSDLKILILPEDDRPGILTSKTFPTVRIIISDAAYFASVRSKISGYSRHTPYQSKSHNIYIYCMILLIVTGVVTFGWPLAAGLLTPVIPQSWDNALGNYARNSFFNAADECKNPAGKKSLIKLTGGLVTASGINPEIIVTEEKTINAMALPGNKIIIFSGLIDFAKTPDELAGVIAHEMGHLHYRHSTENFIRQYGRDIMMSASFGSADMSSALKFGQSLWYLSYSRKDETAADNYGYEILQKSNIGGQGLSRFFKRVEDEEKTIKIPKFFSYLSTHPQMPEREKSLPKSNLTYVINQTEWNDIKAICK